MIRKKKQLILTDVLAEGVVLVKVRLDHRTVVYMKSIKSFASWKARYPLAEVMG